MDTWEMTRGRTRWASEMEESLHQYLGQQRKERMQKDYGGGVDGTLSESRWGF